MRSCCPMTISAMHLMPSLEYTLHSRFRKQRCTSYNSRGIRNSNINGHERSNGSQPASRLFLAFRMCLLAPGTPRANGEHEPFLPQIRLHSSPCPMSDDRPVDGNWFHARDMACFTSDRDIPMFFYNLHGSLPNFGGFKQRKCKGYTSERLYEARPTI
jgi:hypothetical protein